MPFNWRRWTPPVKKKEPTALPLLTRNGNGTNNPPGSIRSCKREDMAIGAQQSETFLRMCKQRNAAPEAVLNAIEEKLENPQGTHWRRLSAWWNVARMEIYERELPSCNERIGMETTEEKAKREAEDMQREGLWIAKAITHYSEKTVEKKLGKRFLQKKVYRPRNRG